MKYIKTYDNFKPIKINSAKPFKVKKNLDKSIKYLQNGIKSIRRRLDDPKNRKIANHTKLNTDKNKKIQALKDLQYKKIKQQEYLNSIKESLENKNLLDILQSEDFKAEDILNYIGLEEDKDYIIENKYDWEKKEYYPKYNNDGITLLLKSKKLEKLMNLENGIISELTKFLSQYNQQDYYVDDDELNYLNNYTTKEINEKIKKLGIKFGYSINPEKEGEIYKLFLYLSLKSELDDIKNSIATEHEKAIKETAIEILESVPFKIDNNYSGDFDLELEFEYSVMIEYMKKHKLDVKTIKEFLENIYESDNFNYEYQEGHYNNIENYDDAVKDIERYVDKYLENPDEIFPILIKHDNLDVFKKNVKLAYFSYEYDRIYYYSEGSNLFQLAKKKDGKILQWFNSKEFEDYIKKNGDDGDKDAYYEFKYGETLRKFNL